MYMKKWQLNFKMNDGRIWSGWINTMSENKDDFPEALNGSFWTEKDKEGAKGLFELGDGVYQGRYVFGAMRTPEYMPKSQSLDEFEKAFNASKLLNQWERVEKRIEDCLSEGSYVIKV